MNKKQGQWIQNLMDEDGIEPAEEEVDDEQEEEEGAVEEDEDDEVVGEDDDEELVSEDDDEDEVSDEDDDDDDEDNKKGDGEELDEEVTFSDKDLTSLPKPIRAAVAKLNKADRSVLMGWVNKHNEEKREIVTKANAIHASAKEMDGQVERSIEALKGAVSVFNQKANDPKIKESLDAFIDSATTTFAQKQMAWFNQVGAAVQGDVDSFLQTLGIKDCAKWAEKNPEQAFLVKLSGLTNDKKQRTRLFNLLENVVADSLRKKKVAPRASKTKSKPKSMRSDVMKGVERLLSEPL